MAPRQTVNDINNGKTERFDFVYREPKPEPASGWILLFSQDAEYLGFVVSEKGIQMNHEYVDKILNWPL